MAEGNGSEAGTGERHVPATARGDWEAAPGIPGLRVRELWQGESGSSIALLKFDKGRGITIRHRHASNQFMYCVSGEYRYLEGGPTLAPGDFYMNPKGNLHGPTEALQDSVLLEIYDGPHYFEDTDPAVREDHES